MPIISADRPNLMLVHPAVTTTYSFRPPITDGTHAGVATVEIVHTTTRGRHVHTLSTEEARQLWRRLRGQGFERF